MGETGRSEMYRLLAFEMSRLKLTMERLGETLDRTDATTAAAIGFVLLGTQLSVGARCALQTAPAQRSVESTSQDASELATEE
jgi:hypothetical protein